MTALRFALACLALAAVPQVCFAQKDASRHFGPIRALCKTAGCPEVKQYLDRIDAECAEDDAECKPANDLLKTLFGVYVPSLPKYVLYLEQPQPGVFRPHRPVLMWQKKNTPHIYGSRQIYALVFSEAKTCISGSVTTNYRSDPNPLTLVFGVLGTKLDAAAAAKPPDSKAMTFHWYPLSGNYGDKLKERKMWVALGGISIDENTVNWISVEPAPLRPKPASGAPAVPDECVKSDEVQVITPGAPEVRKEETVGARDLVGKLDELAKGKVAERVVAEGKRRLVVKGAKGEVIVLADEPGDGEAPIQTGSLAGDAFFSNSPGGYATVAVALGTTRHVRDTSLASGGSNSSYNGYALVKFYVPGFRPELRPVPTSPCYWVVPWFSVSARCPSLGVFFGTNVRNDPFSEIVYGVSVGHIFENVGVVVGRNSIAGGKNGQEGRQSRPFFGIDYSF